MIGLHQRRVVLGVSGGIAAYKAADLVSKLVQAGAIVDVVMTDRATAFVQPLTFEALTGRPVRTTITSGWSLGDAGHVGLADGAELLIIAPATANTIARLAHGFADDWLTATYLSTTAPSIIAPAMEHHMYHHPATQANLALLRKRGVLILGPERGHLASGAVGDGRLATTETLIGAARWRLGQEGPLSGQHVLVTAGGTQEPLDPVRYLGNRSSGHMGYALAQAALDHGAQVTLITTPTALLPPFGAETQAVNTAAEMLDAVQHAARAAQVLIMAAAVADFRPLAPSDQKLKKSSLGDQQSLILERTVDILASIGGSGLLKVGFAAETENLVANAQAKLTAKRLDLLIANDAVATIGAPDSGATIIGADGTLETLPRMPKADLSERILARIVMLLDQGGRATNGD